MVLATRRTRVKPRAERRSRSAACSARVLASGSRVMWSIAASALVADALGSVAFGLGLAGGGDAGGNGGAGFPGGGSGEFGGGDWVDVDDHVDAVEEGAADAGEVVFAAAGGFVAFAGGVAEVAAAAGVHGGDELESGGVGDVGAGAGDGGSSAFQGLAEGFEGGTGEFGEFVEEEDAAVGEADFAGPGAVAAAGEGGLGGAVMRFAEGGAHDEAAAIQHAGHAVDHADFQGVDWGEVWQEVGQAGGEHGFSGAGGADEHEGCGCRRRRLPGRGGRFPCRGLRTGRGRVRRVGHRRVRAG